MIKPLLDKDTVSKIQVHYGVPQAVSEIFDLEKLPKEYGGNREFTVPYPLDSKHFDEDLIVSEVYPES